MSMCPTSSAKNEYVGFGLVIALMASEDLTDSGRMDQPELKMSRFRSLTLEVYILGFGRVLSQCP